MSVARRITHYLDFHDITFEAIQRGGAVPDSSSTRKWNSLAPSVAHVVVVRTEDSYYMVVVPTGKTVEVDRIRKMLQLPHCRRATDSEIAGIFSDCEVDAIPALGNLYNVPVVLDESFGKDENICFHGGTHHDLVLMRYCDFAELTDASVVSVQA